MYYCDICIDYSNKEKNIIYLLTFTLNYSIIDVQRWLTIKSQVLFDRKFIIGIYPTPKAFKIVIFWNFEGKIILIIVKYYFNKEGSKSLLYFSSE